MNLMQERSLDNNSTIKLLRDFFVRYMTIGKWPCNYAAVFNEINIET
jgi:hypothetical protein